MADIRSTLISEIQKIDGTACVSIEEYKENQFGIPLRHYAQQYLYGSTGLRFGVMHSISGPPQSCKSPFVFDLMFSNCMESDKGGPEGISYLYELEDKLSPTLLLSMAAQYGQRVGDGTPFQIVKNLTLEKACVHLNKLLDVLQGADFATLPPIFINFDSIGGAATESLVSKIRSEGFAGKGFHEKAHIMKHLCENWGALVKTLPIIFMAVNQEKADVQAIPGYNGPPKKHITGGESQLFKAGHIVSARYRELDNGVSKMVTLKTSKTSFCDSRKIDVKFTWNRAGNLESADQGHRWEWAMAGALALANPAYVGDLRDIVDVKVSQQGLVTCPQLGCKSVSADDFEAALFDSANTKILNDLYSYQKIEKIKGVDELRQYIKANADKVKKSKEEAKAANKLVIEAAKEAKEAEKAAKEAAKQSRLKARESKNKVPVRKSEPDTAPTPAVVPEVAEEGTVPVEVPVISDIEITTTTRKKTNGKS